MSTIVTRSGKGSPLTHVEVDANFTNLNTDKYQSGDAVSFTTLTATGQTSLGGAAGSESLRVGVVSSAVNFWFAQGSVTGSGIQFRPSGNDTNIPALFSSKGSSQQSFYTNTFAQEQLRVAHTASAVNYVQVTGAATGGRPSISAQGSDASAGLQINAKGGSSIFFSGNGNNTAFALSHVTSATNYLSAAPSVTGSAPLFSAQGTDTNVSMAFQSKGTGAIDLAAGSSGVNISNGGTVTALTVTAAGSAYTTIPTPAITAPTTAGGVQAVATATMNAINRTIISGGTGYTLNDTITVVGGTFTTAATFTVSGVTGGVVNALTAANGGTYSVLPTGTLTTTGGTGTGLTLTIDTWGVRGLTIGTAGSGYVEQPTVSFSGGGGSGAAAYATVGAGTTFKTVGTSLSFSGPAGEVLRLNGNAPSGLLTDYMQIDGGVNGVTNGVYLRASGSSANQAIYVQSKGTSAIGFFTNWVSNASQQLSVAHTASAVNYVQVTGAATSSTPVISAQGSDTGVGLSIMSKNSSIVFYTGNALSNRQFNILHTVSPVNYLQVTGNTTGNAPILSAQGSDTNIDLTLTPKGTGATVANGDFKMNSGYGSAATAYGCRAWVNFNGTGTVAIRASGNVSSITDNGTGNYTVNFTNALPDVNYSCVTSVKDDTGAAPSISFGFTGGTYSTTQVRLQAWTYLGTQYDSSIVTLAIFR